MAETKGKLRSFGRIALALLYPPRCPACDTVTGSLIEGNMCKDCRETFENNFVSRCPVCKRTSGECGCAPDVLGNEWDRSPFTTTHPLLFGGYYTGFDEEDSVTDLVYKMKRDRRSDAGIVFARIIARTLSRYFVENKISPTDFTVTYIPRSRKALNDYGFDHMKTVAARVSEMLGCGFADLLLRKGGTQQKKLGGEERRKNAVSTIYLKEKKSSAIRGAKLIIIDDIITTGSTMRTAVSLLSFGGADTLIPAAAMVSATKKKKSHSGKL